MVTRMSSVLILSGDADASRELEAIAQRFGFRVKTTGSVTLARDWLKLKHFDAVLLGSDVGFADQETIGHELWSVQPEADLIIFDLSKNSERNNQDIRLFGAELARGTNARSRIEKLFEQIKSNRENNSKISSLNTLVVEDLDAARDIICSYVEMLGFGNTTAVASAQEALDELSKHPGRYSCVLTDVRMPQMDGREFISRVRANPKLAQLPIVVLTAYGTIDCLMECLQAGASGFLTKPPKKPDLSRELSRAFRIIRNHRDPRLASADEALLLRESLLRRGLV